jgi:hypothetical protein
MTDLSYDGKSSPLAFSTRAESDKLDAARRHIEIR